QYFERTLLPIVTPLAIDPGHPFPYLASRSLCLVVSLTPRAPSVLPHAHLSVMHIPAQAPRFVALPAAEGHYAFILLEDIIRLHLGRLYEGYDVRSTHALRVTRDADVQTPHDDGDDLIATIEQNLRERRMGSAVRLQYDRELPAEILATVIEELELSADALY